MPVIDGPVEFEITEIWPNYNVVWAINTSVAALKSPNAPTLDRAMNLRFLEHFVGDVHQPLHIMTMYSDMFRPPSGDGGGNKYLIQASMLCCALPCLCPVAVCCAVL